MKITVNTIGGGKSGEVDLPNVFKETYRPDLIKKAFLAQTSTNYQPKGADPMAGKRSSAASWGVGGGMSRIPRVKAGPRRGGREARGRAYRSKGRWFAAASEGRIIPGTVGGRQAHPPKAFKNLILKVNKEEKRKALCSAIAATANLELVSARGHSISELKALPLVIEDKFEEVKKTKEAIDTLKKIGLKHDLKRCEEKKTKAGKGKTRGRKFKSKKGPLIVLSENKGAELACRNIPGVEVVRANDLNIEHLAPGSRAGRLTLWTKSSLEGIKGRFK